MVARKRGYRPVEPVSMVDNEEVAKGNYLPVLRGAGCAAYATRCSGLGRPPRGR